MQEVVVPYRQLADGMVCLATKVLGEARPLEMRKERRIICAPEDSSIQQETEEPSPPGRIPLALEECALRVDRVASEQTLDARARMDEKPKRDDHTSDEALSDPSA